jgi:hypothetical protein
MLKSARVPFATSSSNSEKGTKFVARRFFNRGMWIRATAENDIGSCTYTFQVRPCASSRSKRVSAVLWLMKFDAGLLITKPDEVAAVQNDRFISVWEGTSQNQWSNTPKPFASALSTGTCSGV